MAGLHFVRGLVVIVGTTAACATTHVVRPLGRGNASLNASLGGPLVEVASVVTPVPILSVGGAYGLRDDVEVFGHADLTAALYGDLHVEPGLAYHPVVRQSGVVPTVTIAGSVQFLTDFSDTRAIPQITVAAGWRVGGRHMLYAGVDNALAFGSPRGTSWVPSSAANCGPDTSVWRSKRNGWRQTTTSRRSRRRGFPPQTRAI